MAAKKKRPGIEWVGGLVSMPGYVTGEGPPYRPEALFWMNAEGAVLGHVAGRPGEVIGLASETLRSTIEHPMYGPPHAPQRLRVAEGGRRAAEEDTSPESDALAVSSGSTRIRRSPCDDHEVNVRTLRA